MPRPKKTPDKETTDEKDVKSSGAKKEPEENNDTSAVFTDSRGHPAS